MIKNNLFIKDSIPKKYFKFSEIAKLNKGFKSIFKEVSDEINSPNKTLSVLSKKFKFNFTINDLKKFRRFQTIALVGMGGSILGSEAIHNFFEKRIKKKIYFFNDLDEEKIIKFKNIETSSKVLFIVISKSGNTIETLSNMFSLNIIKKNSKNIILISEKKNNLIYLMSRKYNLFYVEHKQHIGGRYSVLSESGIIPSYLMGVNIIKLRSKTLDYLRNKNKTFLKNSSIKIANLIKSKKFNNLIFLNYSPELEKFLFWCQQLIAESLGKKSKGFLPVISNVPKDHHSLLQLYLDGPKDKLFYIFSLEKKSREKIIIKNKTFKNNFLNKKKLGAIKNAQKQSLIKTFIKKNIPFREFKIKEINEEVLGKLFCFFILETIVIGKLLKINPFNQPAVEQVKVYTKELLN